MKGTIGRKNMNDMRKSFKEKQAQGHIEDKEEASKEQEALKATSKTMSKLKEQEA